MTPPDPEAVERVAKGLTKAQRSALRVPPAWGLPPGHNQWFDLTYHEVGDPEAEICDGEDVDAVVRLGLIVVGEKASEGGVHLVDEERDVEPRWPLNLTPLGQAVQRLFQEQKYD
jgi:hypothetical protein